jgi:dolichyl-phosphate beta-glucosyltransferase
VVPALSIVIPAYNEARRLGPTLARLGAFLQSAERGVEVLVVDDGSRDATAEVARRAADAAGLPLRLVRREQNRGKGASVREGMLAARGARRLMCDADLSTPIEELARLEAALETGADIAIGSRDLPASRLEPPQPPARRLAAWIFRALRRRLLLADLRDTQCGFKLFTAAAAADLFARVTVDGWLFDCEVLALARQRGYRIREVGVLWRNDRDTRVWPPAVLVTAVPTLLAIRHRTRRPACRPGD